MVSSYQELMDLVEERRQDVLTIEVDLGATFSQEYEDAKQELAQAKAMQTLTGGKGFLSDNIQELEAKAEALKPTGNPVWIRFRRLGLIAWAALLKQAGVSPIDQYEKVLPETFIGVYGAPDDDSSLLSDDPRLLSSKGSMGILPGGSLNQVLAAFMAWQNTSGDVAIRPTKSGRA